MQGLAELFVDVRHGSAVVLFPDSSFVPRSIGQVLGMVCPEIFLPATWQQRRLDTWLVQGWITRAGFHSPELASIASCGTIARTARER